MISLAKTNFCCYSTNPVKLCVLILNLLTKLELKFKNIKLDTKDIKSSYYTLIDYLLKNIDEMNVVESMLKEK